MRARKAVAVTLNNATRASDPGLVILSHEKLRRLEPHLFPRSIWSLVHYVPTLRERWARWLLHIEEHLNNGDSRAAVVVHLEPLIVAAYTDELDCVALLEFPDEFAQEYQLRVGSRLLTVNTYKLRSKGIAPDLLPGEREHRRYGNFSPYIAEFLSDDNERIAERKAEIAEEEWQRAERMGREALVRNNGATRDGGPLLCMEPAELE
jgi:hypothetical protein